MTSDPSVPEPAPPAEGARRPVDRPRDMLGAEGLRPVSPRLVPARYVAAIAWYVIGLLLVAGAVVLYVLLGWWWPLLVAVLPIALIVQSLLFTPRRVRAMGYRDGEEDLVVASGIMFREVHTIPYGRVQSVKIDEGPVARRYGLATLTVTTAAGGTDVSLEGLPKDEAERLRALLTDRGIDLMAAL